MTLKELNSNETIQVGPCACCGRKTRRHCGQCQAELYCSGDCQAKSWKEHKNHCFPPGSICMRCNQVIQPKSCCHVPHPEHLQKKLMSTFSSKGYKSMFACTACESTYSRLHDPTKVQPQSCDTSPIVEGAEWCFSGYHTIKALPKKNEAQRVYHDLVTLTTGPTLQDQIAALHGNETVRVITLKSSDGLYNKDPVFFPDLFLPNLEEFHSIDVNLGRLNFTEELTPQLQFLLLQNPTSLRKPDFTIECPTLKVLALSYLDPGDYTWLLKLLATATELEEFEGYKIMVDYLYFASNALQRIYIERGDTLAALEIWAPCLTLLELQSCHDLRDIHFLSQHDPLDKELGPDFKHWLPLLVRTNNVLLGPRAIEAIAKHPRVPADMAKRVAASSSLSAGQGL